MKINKRSREWYQDQSKQLSEWLVRLNRDYFDIQSCIVTIGEEMFSGVRYKQNMTPPPGASNPAPYVDEQIYLIGKRPKLKKKNVALTVEGDSREWYFIAYFDISDSHCKQAIKDDSWLEHYHID